MPTQPMLDCVPHDPVRRARLGAFLIAIVVALAVVATSGRAAHAQDSPLEPLDSSSPQGTYLSFIEQVKLLEELLDEYERNRSERTQAAFTAALADVEDLFDLSEVSSANLDEVAVVSFASLADILNRIPPSDVDEIPDDEAVAEAESSEITVPGSETPILGGGGITSYTLPGTEITIVRADEGPQEGNYVFSAATVSELAEWREEVDDLPVNEGVVVRDWVQVETDFTGHLVPDRLIDALPDAFDADVLGAPLWKVLVDIVLFGVIGLFIWLWYRLVGRGGNLASVRGQLRLLSTPTITIVLMVLARRFMNEQVNHGGDVATVANLTVSIVIWASLAWAFWILTKLCVEWIIASPAVGGEGIDSHLVRLLGTVIAVSGTVLVGLVGLSRIGVPTLGLGIGASMIGIAVGLAATGTLENLIGGITVYADKPFAVDDDILVDADFGTVEEIGPRSTAIRRLDDTKVILPNADISRVKVINFSNRRHIQFLHVIGVRYETTVEQLRTIVETIDTRFREHPMVQDLPDRPRVRVVGFGASSIDIEVRARVDTGNYSEFLAAQQELLLLLYEIVEAAGTGFAFPSTTAYIADDTGLPEALDNAILQPAVHTAPAVHHTVPSDEFTRDDSAVLTDDDGAASEAAD